MSSMSTNLSQSIGQNVCFLENQECPIRSNMSTNFSQSIGQNVCFLENQECPTRSNMSAKFSIVIGQNVCFMENQECPIRSKFQQIHWVECLCSGKIGIQFRVLSCQQTSVCPLDRVFTLWDIRNILILLKSKYLRIPYFPMSKYSIQQIECLLANFSKSIGQNNFM